MPQAGPSVTTLPALDDPRPRTVTDQIFDLLYENVVDLSLPPGAKLSEAEVAAQMGVSRQPVRDAFYRLSQLGFIQIRPQRATTVTPISEEAVMQAYFIRLALEEACIRVACDTLTPANFDDLDRLIVQQEAALAADRRAEFHALDDRFHHDICAHAGLKFVWALVRENKGHMDRARYLSLSYNASIALDEHRRIMAALRARDPEAATTALRLHLGRIKEIVARLQIDQPDVFSA
ncbi:transcriptional regulator, GntR family [Paracoccus halophilus]|uniref:GntR family transcriptional regulator n=1 Tax=Paracoccus halophilus TaxID=376733 RepID=A0A099EXQ2_9RHOB|nr:GntR family transcriptional regulator [Paracoccus halophilus]KGJ03215.1 GntR family transcriptional regulator [Paracoccus halophilus]SFA52879.1 transcriptional regulator, GntR family [Paracoccus halophilus]